MAGPFIIHVLTLAENLSRIAIAIDYNENGYRLLLQSGINDPCLVNSMLAVAASHYSKWQKTQDTESRPYLRKALLHLQARLKDPRLIYTEGTVVAMLLLVSYEVTAFLLTRPGGPRTLTQLYRFSMGQRAGLHTIKGFWAGWRAGEIAQIYTPSSRPGSQWSIHRKL